MNQKIFTTDLAISFEKLIELAGWCAPVGPATQAHLAEYLKTARVIESNKNEATPMQSTSLENQSTSQVPKSRFTWHWKNGKTIVTALSGTQYAIQSENQADALGKLRHKLLTWSDTKERWVEVPDSECYHLRQIRRLAMRMEHKKQNEPPRKTIQTAGAISAGA